MENGEFDTNSLIDQRNMNKPFADVATRQAVIILLSAVTSNINNWQTTIASKVTNKIRPMTTETAN